jgi:hypothetical protein
MDAAFDLSTGKPSVPPALLADLTGDGRTDLAIGEGEERLFVYAGNGSDEIFERKPLEIEVRLPGNGRDLVTAQDVDTNGADDVIIRYGRVDGSARRTTMQLLLSKPNEVVAGTQAR